MKQNVTGNDIKSKRESKVKMAEELPYYKDIRMSWKVNQRHCDPNAPDRREHYINRGILFDDIWLGELGWIRYYLFHIDNGYEKGKSKLIRIDDNKGFSPSNCRIVDKAPPKVVSTKAKAPKVQPPTDIKTDSTTTPASIINHFMIFTSDSMKSKDIIEILKSVGNQPIDDEHNKIIYLDTAENQSIKRKNAKN